MNIKIHAPISEDLVILTLPFGSRVYGTATLNSDYDYIKILKKSTGDFILQYQGEQDGKRVDCVYVDHLTFCKRLRDGSNIPMFEAALHSNHPTRMFGVDIYATAKAYLGLAKRDLHYSHRIHHVNRCLAFANALMCGELPDLTSVRDIPTYENRAVLGQIIDHTRQQLNKQFKKT